MMKQILAPVVLSGAVVGALALSTTAGAGTPTPAPTAAATTPAHAGRGAARVWLKAHRKELRAAGVTISAKTIGITPQALAADLKAGTSVAAVAGQHNVSVATVVGALDDAAVSEVNQAVGSHKLTQGEATRIVAGLPGLLTTWVNHTF
ncbi:MAG TPA: hypothetical protein VF320_02405 [Acidimicrobiales bacterium]